MSTYLELVEGVKSYYGSGSDQWLNIAKYGVNQQTLPLIKQVPGVTIIRSASGQAIGYDYKNPFPSTYNPIADIDSNVQSGSYGLSTYTAQVPATAIDDGAGGLTMRSGALTTSAGSVLRTVADRVSLGLAGVALGSKLGLAIDSALYQANPRWWDEHFPSLNPETWQQIIPEGDGGDMLRSLIGIGDSGDATMYLDERVLGYAYLAMLKGGAWSSGSGGSADWDQTIPSDFDLTNVTLPITYGPAQMTVSYVNQRMIYSATADLPTESGWYWHSSETGHYDYTLIAASESPFTVTEQWRYPSGQVYETRTYDSAQITVNGRTFWYAWYSHWSSILLDPLPTCNEAGDKGPKSNKGFETIAYIMLYGDIIDGRPSGMDANPEAGFQIDPSQVINPTTGEAVTPSDDLDDVLDALRTAYPDLFSGSTYQDVPQDDGTVTRITYLPVPYPATTPEGLPVTDTTAGVDPQTSPQVDPQTRPDTAGAIADSVIGPPDPPATGSGETPPAIVPTGSADALYSIYNPTDSELRSFGAWLWSSSFVDQLLKLFSDPMQAIIGLHKVFAPPPVSGRGPIKVGYLSSGVDANLVSGQYVTVECGSVRVPEYFGSALDYDPFTRIQIYLPFIGIQPLDVGDVMRGTVSVRYHVDILTGACLAEVSVARDGAGGTLYTYAGNASVQYPISSGSYMGIMSSMISIAGGIAGTIASGGALAPVALGAAGGLMSARTRVQHSGSFSGNAGAMGARIPYLIISRAQSAVADDYERYEGSPANKTTNIGSCSGYIRCKAVHLEGIPATATELDELERLLADGIII